MTAANITPVANEQQQQQMDHPVAEPLFANVRESVEFNRSRLEGTLPHHPDLPLVEEGEALPPTAGVTSSISRVALNHANANDRHVAWSDASATTPRSTDNSSATPPILPSQLLLSTLADPGVQHVPSAPAPPPSSMSNLVDIHWTPRAMFSPTPQLTTMYAYTNDHYRSPKSHQGQQTGGGIIHERHVSPTWAGEGGMTPIPGQEQVKEGEEEGKEGVVTSYDYSTATADDTDEDLGEEELHLHPVNVDDLPTPTPSYLAQKLPPHLHPFLARSCKKDCRMWLWKNEIGRRAREVLVKARGIVSQTDSTLSGNANTLLSTINNTVDKAEDNNFTL